MIEDPSAGLSKFPHGNLFQADPPRPNRSRPSQEFHNPTFSLGLHDPACGGIRYGTSIALFFNMLSDR
jgi:hypothetical protein